MINLLFVYGTLRSEFDAAHARQLRAAGQLMGRTTVPGSIFDLDGYPGYRPDAPGEISGEVTGEIWRLTDPGTTLAALDDWESPAGFERVMAQTAGGDSVWIYQFASDPPASARIPSGDYLWR